MNATRLASKAARRAPTVLLEALRVDQPDNPVPLLEVRWVKAAGGSRMRTVVHPAGEKAIAAPP